MSLLVSLWMRHTYVREATSLDDFEFNSKLSLLLARHQSFNSRIKEFRILSDVYRHDLDNHVLCFCAVLNIQQLKLHYSPLMAIVW